VYYGGGNLGRNVRINITISEELDREFRRVVAETLGFKRGNLQRAVEEALRLWIKTKRERKVE